GQQVTLTAATTAVDEERLIDFRNMNGNGNMIGRVGAQSARIFIAILAELTEREPDPLIARVFLVGNDRLAFMADSGHRGTGETTFPSRLVQSLLLPMRNQSLRQRSG